MPVKNRAIRRLTSRPTNGYGRTRVGKTFGKLGKLKGSGVPPAGAIDTGVRVRKGRRLRTDG